MWDEIERVDSKLFVVLAVWFVLFDRMFKVFAGWASEKAIIDGGALFGFEYALNNGHTLIDILISGAALAFLLVMVILFKAYHWLPAMMFAGVASNMIDRIYFGGVVDYLMFCGVTFNFADVMIVGAFVLIAMRLVEAHMGESSDE